MNRVIPSWLTSHRAVLLALVALAVASFVVSATDDEFAFTPGQLALSLLIAVTVSGAVTYVCAAVVRVPPGADSWLITGLILFFILPGVSDRETALTVAVGAVAAAASKYVLAWRRRLIVNPAVAGAVVVYALAYAEVGGIGYPIWWIAAEPLLIPMMVIGVLLVTALREWRLVVVFLLASLASMGVLELAEGGQSLQFWYISSPTFFVAAIMLPEPLSSPTTRLHRLVYAAVVGVLMYWQVSIPVSDAFSIEFVPEIALLVGSLYAFVVRVATRSPSGRVSLTFADRARFPADRAQLIADDTYELILVAPTSLSFAPGQWALLSAPAWSRPLWHRSRRVFSYAEAPGADEVRFAFTTGETPSHVKRALIDGDVRRLYLDSSGGDFVLRRSRPDTPIILLAAGIGITPFRSMLMSAMSIGGDLGRFTVIHVVRGADRRVYDDMLDAARQSGASVHVVETGAGADGVDDDLIRNLVGAQRPSQFYISGSPGFVRSTAGVVRRIDPSTRLQFWRVHTDAFLGY
ncbi:oxidoreductase [Gordonia sp. ABSL11-1]|uniref:ferredoxin--NADP reductase n=1 Tax=Gordonia sp. ABSL11-1 TaxID=3053924 RepID=UPI0025748D8B|nr:oxidoreductase [Gordonia sp. ABSL11-1]MDL9948799.1 oxidoreductase [Gordonia sp. ABSL11-1]